MAVRGHRTLKRRLRAIVKQMPKETADRLDDRARQLLGRAIAIAPELERHLILSGRVEKSDNKRRQTRSVSFDTPYAVAQHEGQFNPGPITSAKAPTQDGTPGRKFLERPYRNMIGDIQADIGQAAMDVTRVVIRAVKGKD